MDAYTKHNVSLWAITAQNEPLVGFNDKYQWNSLGFSAEMMRDFIKLNLGPTLAKAGYGIDRLKQIIIDDQRPHVSHWAHVILSDPQASKYVSGMAFHWYENTVDNIVELDKAHNEFPDYFLLATEGCEEWKGRKDKVQLGDWQAFDRYAFNVISVSIITSCRIFLGGRFPKILSLWVFKYTTCAVPDQGIISYFIYIKII